MKAKVIVATTKTVEADINNDCLTEEFMDEFEIFMFPLNEKATRIESMVAYVCSQIAEHDGVFIEGIGRPVHTHIYNKGREDHKDTKIVYSISFDGIAAEIKKLLNT